ncbi:hypothetical protein B9T62_35575 [Paenibacillus donghaensis]|uniref:Uncharacterized protein n=1 Tax=Paenibacillus donghaensis TaxID=414771 RepID=A0A2Z2KRV1_9BACL|nr:hypothetical protein B9T62_35575 [Paenibacillus donghaensis]
MYPALFGGASLLQGQLDFRSLLCLDFLIETALGGRNPNLAYAYEGAFLRKAFRRTLTFLQFQLPLHNSNPR